MGYRLTQQIMEARPPRPGPEWWLLYEMAMDASDRTRRTACGYEYMAERTQAPRSTIFRWLARLADDGLLQVISHSRSAGRGGGKGERAVYEVQVPSRVAARVTAALNQVPSSVRPDSVLRSHKKGPDSTGNQVSPGVGPDSGANWQVGGNQVPPAVRPPLQDPTGRASVESDHLRSDQDHGEEEVQGPPIGPEREARRALAAQAGPQPQETETPMRPGRKRRPAA